MSHNNIRFWFVGDVGIEGLCWSFQPNEITGPISYSMSGPQNRVDQGESRKSLAPLQSAMAVATTFWWCRSAQPPANN
jgi:hypothetical protein